MDQMEWAWHEAKRMAPVILCAGGVLFMMLGLFNYAPGRNWRGRIAQTLLVIGLLALILGILDLLITLTSRY